MPSGLSDTVVNNVLNSLLGSSAGSILGTTVYLHAYTTAPTDDNGTGRVDWGQGSLAVTVTDGTAWPAASGRSKVSELFTVGTNSSGATINVVAVGWETAASSGTYLGGGPVAGSTEPVANGAALTVTATLSAPSPS